MGKITIFSIMQCPHCKKAKALFDEKEWPYVEISLTEYPEKRPEMIAVADRTSVPQIFFNEQHLGGASDLVALNESGKLDPMYAEMLTKPDPTDPRLMKPDYPPKVEPTPVAKEDERFQIGDATYEYEELMAKFLRPKKEGGVDVDDRTYHFKKYHRCFIGEDFTSYLMKEFGIQNRADAIQVAVQLEEGELFHHVTGDHGFEDKKLFYRFQAEAEKCSLNMLKIWKGPPVNDPMVALNGLKKQLSAVLAGHTDSNGLVDYAKVHDDPKFKEFQANTSELQAFNLASMDVKTRKAFCINMYNMLVIHGYAQVGVPSGAFQIVRFFGNIAYRVGEFDFTANEIENGILRGNKHSPTSMFKYFSKRDQRLATVIEGGDHRIHFALNCGAKSCPPVKNYTREGVEEELRIAGQAFCEDDGNCKVDVEKGKLHLSKILSWYGVDFGSNSLEVAMTVLQYCRGEKKEQLQALISTGKVKLSFNHYDWSNNAKTSPEFKVSRWPK